MRRIRGKFMRKTLALLLSILLILLTTMSTINVCGRLYDDSGIE